MRLSSGPAGPRPGNPFPSLSLPDPSPSGYNTLLRGLGDYHGHHVIVTGGQFGVYYQAFYGSGFMVSSLDPVYWNHILVTARVRPL